MDDYEPGPVPPQKPLDRFGFIKQNVSSTPEGLAKNRIVVEYERYAFSLIILFQALLADMTVVVHLYDFILHVNKH